MACYPACCIRFRVSCRSQSHSKTNYAKRHKTGKISQSSTLRKKVLCGAKTVHGSGGKGEKELPHQIEDQSIFEEKHLGPNAPKTSIAPSICWNTDLRGTVKRKVIGPKLGQRIGQAANAEGKAIKYRSVRNGGSNIAVPGSMISKHPRALYGKTLQ
jgi:hypothetical protein